MQDDEASSMPDLAHSDATEVRDSEEQDEDSESESESEDEEPTSKKSRVLMKRRGAYIV